MDDTTPNLILPYIMAAQAQKHVTHNEAIRILDALLQVAVVDRHLATPPATPTNGVRYIVPTGATGAWAGQVDSIAAFQDGAWEFYAPREGWLAWMADEDVLLAWTGTAWTLAAGGSVNPTSLVGVNATADATNRLAVSSPASLFNHEGAGHQLKINKATTSDTASVLFQTAFSGRAEFGLTGDDKWHVKVSPDGSAWTEAVVVDPATGNAGFGTSAPTKPLEVVRTGTQADITATTYGVNGGGILHGRLARGTEASPAPVLAGDIVAGIGGRAWHSGGAFQTSSPAAIHWVAAENQTATAFGSYLRFLTTPLGSTTRQERLRIGANGGISIGTQADADRPLVISSSGNPLPAGNATMMIVGQSNKERFELRSFGGDPVFQGKRSAGTEAAPLATLLNSFLFALGGAGHDGTAFVTGNRALVGIKAAENWTATAQGSYIALETTAEGAILRAERVRIEGDGTTRPGADNAYTLGNASFRWASIWAANGTIQTSDARDKEVSARIAGATAAAAVDAVAPVMFRWKVGRNEMVPHETETVVEDGEVVPKMVARPIPGKRLHAGFLAQEVKTAMDAANVDFGVWGLDDPADPDSRQWLRPDQLIPVLWAALRETRAEVAALRARLETGA